MAGDVGTVVFVYHEREAFELDLVTPGDETIALEESRPTRSHTSWGTKSSTFAEFPRRSRIRRLSSNRSCFFRSAEKILSPWRAL